MRQWARSLFPSRKKNTMDHFSRSDEAPDFAHPQQFSQLRPNSAWYCYRAHTDFSVEQLTEGTTLAVRDIDFVEHETGMNPGWRVLEIGCAWGRHSLELAQRDYSQVVSLDVCPDLLMYTQEWAKRTGYTLNIVATDYLDYQPDAPFDIILSLYDRSCLGQPDEAQDRKSLLHLASMLQPGGFLVFGIGDWPRDLPLPSRRWEETPKGIELHEVLVKSATMQCTHRITLMRSNGGREAYELTRVHYMLPQVQAQLAATGFQLLNAYHAFDASRPYGTEHEGLVVVAKLADEK